MDAADRKRITDAYAWTAGAVQRMENDTTPEEQRKARKARASEVEAFLDRKRPEFPVSDNEFNEVRQCAHIVTQYLNMVWPAPGSNIYEARDRSMAENVRWIADKAFPGEKIVLWAHNGHVSKGKYGGPSRSMGDFLHEVFGSKMHVIGFASDHGSIRAIKITATGLSGGPVSLLLPPASKESAEAAFRACGDRFFLDLTHADTATALGKWLQAPHLHRMPGAGYNPDMDSAQYVNVSLPKMYDGIVFLKQSTAAKPIMQR
jgi:erythromycin esterase